jgi:hypothetical protein
MYTRQVVSSASVPRTMHHPGAAVLGLRPSLAWHQGVVSVMSSSSARCRLRCGCRCAHVCKSYCSPACRNIVRVLKIERKRLTRSLVSSLVTPSLPLSLLCRPGLVLVVVVIPVVAAACKPLVPSWFPFPFRMCGLFVNNHQ